jgi:hypothetical protein
VCLFGTRQIRAGEVCKSLVGVPPAELTSYLSEIRPDAGNAECVDFAIRRLGFLKYEPGIPSLAKLLDFKSPEYGRTEYISHLPALGKTFPAVGALEKFGEKSFPVLIVEIKSGSTSATARDNAVWVWMDVYRYKALQGLALLRRDAGEMDDPAVQQNVKWALSRAARFCSPAEKARCSAVARLE